MRPVAKIRKQRQTERRMSRRLLLLIILLLIAVFVAGAILVSRGSVLADASLERVSEMIRGWGIWAPLLSVMLMVGQSLAAPIPGVLIAAANGVVFGYAGIVVSYVGGLAGAAAAYFLARLLGKLVERLRMDGTRFTERVQQISSERGFVIVLVARLIPFVSFDLISFAAGLSSLGFLKFFAATAIGMLPATVAYTVGGVQARALEGYSQIVIIATAGILLLSLLVWMVRRLAAES